MDNIASARQQKLHLIGIGVGHSIAPPMHNYICKRLGKPWIFRATEAATMDEVLRLIRSEEFAGAVVTMPYKSSIMAHLDGLDELATQLGACNNVYLTTDKQVWGSNTDWLGIHGCLLAANSPGVGKPAMIYGAGGASRAAVYALSAHQKAAIIYVINRDAEEVEALMTDTRVLLKSVGMSGPATTMIHIKTVEQASTLSPPHYIISTVPDLVPSTATEKMAASIFDHMLRSAKEPGVFLDMCFKPRVTRKIKLAADRGWKTIQGTEIIGHQIFEQYRLWSNPGSSEGVVDNNLAGDAWKVLRAEAESSPGINFEVD